jgi:hypothetical protein
LVFQVNLPIKIGYYGENCQYNNNSREINLAEPILKYKQVDENQLQQFYGYPCEVGKMGPNCDQDCRIECGYGFCVDKGYYVNTTIFLGNITLQKKLKSMVEYKGYWVNNTNGFMNMVQCVCKDDFTGTNCELYGPSWFRIVYSIFNRGSLIFFLIVFVLQHFIMFFSIKTEFSLKNWKKWNFFLQV